MCVTCGCSDDSEATVTTVGNNSAAVNNQSPNNHPHIPHSHTHILEDGTVITHTHEHHTHEHHTHEHHNHEHHHHNPTVNHSTNNSTNNSTVNTAQIHAQVHSTTLALEQDILGKNNLIAAQNRGWFRGRNILALNLMSSPGAGKTTLLARTIQDLKSQIDINVIEGDQETLNDAEKIKETGCDVVQINTGTGCHLDAAMVEKGLQQLNPPLNSVVAIENVGNLVCPALFDLGENSKIVILSVTEGEDKPIKYPHIFRASQVMILTKIDLLPYVKFDVEKCIDYARQVNPQMQVFQVSALTGVGLDEWYRWILGN